MEFKKSLIYYKWFIKWVYSSKDLYNIDLDIIILI